VKGTGRKGRILREDVQTEASACSADLRHQPPRK
jgi:pyruvate/2-oxoglutarate dehydrogenase complex dihydrolipoamide acyltransferase (E2) component